MNILKDKIAIESFVQFTLVVSQILQESFERKKYVRIVYFYYIV